MLAADTVVEVLVDNRSHGSEGPPPIRHRVHPRFSVGKRWSASGVELLRIAPARVVCTSVPPRVADGRSRGLDTVREPSRSKQYEPTTSRLGAFPLYSSAVRRGRFLPPIRL
jgi:hypothetical protein